MSLQSEIKSAEEAKEQLVPKSRQLVTVLKAERRDTKKGGRMMALVLQIEGGAFEGRWLYANMNLKGDNAWACQQGAAELRSALKALGNPNCDNEEDLIGEQCFVDVDIREGSGSFSDSNIIVGWLPVDGTSAKVTTGAQPAVANPPPVNLDEDSIPF